jgi:glycolate oxidase FAD binding subunit
MSTDAVPGALSAACAEVRPAGPDDAVDGVLARYVASPAGLDEASAVLRAAAADGLATVPRGAGTRLAWGSPPTRCDLVIDTRLMNRVLEHAAGDLVVRVQAGLGLDQLGRVLGEAGQRLALDPPAAATTGNAQETGTVGGMLATGAAGPLRFRYGTPRDLLIGITVVRADGTVASSGGKVVKNVAGYDLGKLFAGSYGTLGLIGEAAFRLHPRPGATSYVTADGADAAGAYAAIAAAAGSPLAPSAAEIDRPARAGPVRVGILLEGDPDGVAERAERMATLLGGSPSVSAEPPGWWGRGAAAASDGTVLRIGFWAAALARVIGAIDAAAAAVGLDPAVSGSAAAGVIYAAVAEDADPAAVAEFVRTLRSALADDPQAGAPVTGSGGAPVSGAGGAYAPAELPAAAMGPAARASVVVQRAPATVRAATDLWGPVPALGLMRAVKDQFDPGHLMAPGRFVGGI